MKIFITGIAGFIGYHTAKRYLADGHEVKGIDNINSSYDPDLKNNRIQNLYELGMPKKNFKLGDINLTDINGMLLDVDLIFHFAADDSGPHASLFEPERCVKNNINATMKLIIAAEREKTPVVYGSSYIEYGYQSTPYGWSKYAVECQFAHSKLKASGVRLFNTYGPYQRPDSVLHKFVDGIKNGTPIDLHDNGLTVRNFTYVDDTIEGIVLVANNLLKSQWKSRHEIFEISTSAKTEIRELIHALEDKLNKKTQVVDAPTPTGILRWAFADNEKTKSLGWGAKTLLTDGLDKYLLWDREYNGVLLEETVV